MKKITIIFLTIVELLVQVIAPVLVPIALLFKRKVEDAMPHYGQEPVQRYKLPRIFRFLETPDELLPGGLYEPAISDLYKKYGNFITSWVWLGTRNVGHGIMWGQGKEVCNRLSLMSEDEKKQYGVYENQYVFCGLKLLTGYKVVRDWYSTKTNCGYWAVPRITIRFANQD